IDPQNEDKLFDTLLEKIRKGDSIGKCAPINKPQFECGFCLKTRDDKKRKVFVNFCISEEVEYPKLDLTEDELSSLLQSEMLSAFKIPMLIEELRPTVDKSGDRNSLVCDIIINEEFYNKRVVSSELYKTLLVTVTLEAIESKNANAITLDKNKWIILKNKKYQNAVNNSSSKSYGERQLVTELNSLPSSSANSAPGVDHLDECMKEFDIGDEQQQDMSATL
ncbi:PIH1 domain-containing protein 1-like protein, partial [Dinothrombium tinctorium]